MLDQPKNDISDGGDFAGVAFKEPGEPVIRGVNWGGFLALYWKEVRRFFKVQLQTIWAPSITTLLFLIIFTVALGRGGRMALGVPFADFIAPGLICMGMLQNAFANSSFALLVGKIQGTIVGLSDAAIVGWRVAGRAGRSVDDPCLSGRLCGLVSDGTLARSERGCGALVGGDLVCGYGINDAGVSWRANLNLGGEIRPRGGGHEFRCRTAGAAFRYILFDRPIVSCVSGFQPRQSVFLRDIGLSVRFPRANRLLPS